MYWGLVIDFPVWLSRPVRRKYIRTTSEITGPLCFGDAWVTLEGTVDWQFQKEAAEDSVQNLMGVKGVTNLIQVKAQVSKFEVKSAIEAALKRSAEVDAKNITVETNGDQVILRGTVRSWSEREGAQRAAWRAPGVLSVDNRITIVSAAAA